MLSRMRSPHRCCAHRCAITTSVRAATIQIVMENLEIKPAEASAGAGDTVELINKDVLPIPQRRGALAPNQTISFVLKKERRWTITTD